MGISVRYILDPNLERFATSRQWEVLKALEEHGSELKAAKALGCVKNIIGQTKKAVLKKAAQNGYAPDHDLIHIVPDGLKLGGTSIRYGPNGEIQQYWNKTKAAGRDPEETIRLPDPKTIVKVSTNFDNQGLVAQQWVTEKPSDVQREKLWREFAAELSADLPRVKSLPAPKRAAEHLMACYPVGDHHLGMLSWDQETGQNYDLTIAEQSLVSATDHLVRAVPACERAVIAFLGDYLHYDSFETVTPTSRNMLDADGRFPKMVRAGIRAMRYLIETAARYHQSVHVKVEIGNHDLSSSVFLMECLANIYEKEPRITIDTSPMHYHYFDFGKNLVMTHHGHGAKMQDLPLIMAHDRPAEWGRTEFRYIWTGHVHHDSVKDIQRCRVESFRILAPADAWASQKGYRSMQDMKAIVLHKDHGEVARHIVNPGMF
ncbi:MAG TPA: oxidoreductase [Terriglobia bacterium]|nr:oxidoreductase [Terriglobia bacterium]